MVTILPKRLKHILTLKPKMRQQRAMRLFINLTPLIPLSFSRRGGRDFREGAKPPPLLKLPPSLLK